MNDAVGNMKDAIARYGNEQQPLPTTWMTGQTVGLKESLDKRLRKLAEQVDRLAHNGAADMAVMNASTGFIAEIESKIEQPLGNVVAAWTDLTRRIQNPSPPPALASGDRADALIKGLAGLAGRGNRIYELDVLWTMFLEHCPDEFREYWSREQNKGEIVGLIRDKADIREALRKEGCLIWYSADRRFRVVEAVPVDLLDEQKTADRVASDPAGRVCRYCQIHESEWTELEKIDRHVHTGFTRKPIVVREHVHTACKPYWSEWVAMAARVSQREMRVAQGAES